MLSERLHYQSKAGFILINGISRNTGKCELGGFSFRQSHLEFFMDEKTHKIYKKLRPTKFNTHI